MLKVLLIALTVATIVVSGAALAGTKTKVHDLNRVETFISEKLLILPVDEDGLVRVTETKIRKKETPKS